MYELMKPTPYLGTFPYSLISWKGQTLKQITSSIRANGQVDQTLVLKRNTFFHPRPLKIYRREIASTISNTHSCNLRTSSRIDEFNRPGGSIINSNASIQNGLVNTLDDTFPKNSCEKPGTCSKFQSPSENAKRRVRSSGMIKRQFDISKNNDTYCTSTNQYLISRNRSFQQNQYNYIRQGSSTSKPGDSLSSANTYSSNGISHCQKYGVIGSPLTFQYQWIDGEYYTVTVPIGYYTLDNLSALLHDIMALNRHYYISLSSNTNVFLLNIGYNDIKNVVEFQVSPSNTDIYPNTKFSIPITAVWTTPTVPNTVVPGFRITNNDLQNAFGFVAGDYPAIPIPTSPFVAGIQNPLTKQVFVSSFPPKLNPAFVKIYYKPSNPQFAKQGGVSSSEVTLRMKYDSITNSTAVYRNAIGISVGNALAYGVPEAGYTVKDKMGYPLPKYPKFTKTGEYRTCSDTSIRG
uniref:Uncharacterized protein n=1 Tax=viral metagenome TaxID=1070528 RepID=A0A6C0JMB1_9ZZZZ